MPEREVVVNEDKNPAEGDEVVVNGDERPTGEDEVVINGELILVGDIDTLSSRIAGHGSA